MANDQLKEALKAKIAKYQRMLELADLANDPEFREMLMANGNGHKSVPQSPATPQADSSDKPKRPYGILKKTVATVLSSAKQPMTTDGIVAEMRQLGFEFRSDTPTISVNEALNTLLHEKKAKIAKTEGVRNFWVPIGSAQEVIH